MLLSLVAVAAVVAWVWYQRSCELFCVSVREGRVLVVRGRIPQGLLNDFHDVVAADPSVGRGAIRAVKEENGARLSLSGIDEWREQRLRNLFHLYPMSQLRAASPLNRRTIGQWLGVAWIAWLFDRSLRS
jgi:hypothetical protein